MQFTAPAIVCAARAHGETAVIARLMTAQHGMVAAYVAGGRGRHLRPLLVPGNVVQADLRGRSDNQMPFAALELLTSRGPWLGEPLASAALAWSTALTAASLPERHAYPALHEALGALLDAICHAPSARGWAMALIGYEALLLRELGYGGDLTRPDPADWQALLATFDRIGPLLTRYPLAQRRGDVMATRDVLRQRLGRIEG